MRFLVLELFNVTLCCSKVPYENLNEALEATKRGEVWGVIHFGLNFTDELVVRQGDGSAAQNETILASRINVYLDYSGEPITSTLPASFTTLLVQQTGRYP